MLEKIIITVGMVVLGALLAWAFNRFASPDKKSLLLVPLILPALLWFGLSGQLKEISGPGGLQISFAAMANTPVTDLTNKGGLRPVFPRVSTREQVALPAEARYVKKDIGAIAAHVLRGAKTKRIFYWFPYKELDAKRLLRGVRAADQAAHDEITEYLVFGPEMGVIDCYILDVDFVQKENQVIDTLKALTTMPPEQQRAFLATAPICLKPFQGEVTAIEALRRLDASGHDEAIVVNSQSGYRGLAFRDTIVSALVTALTNALLAKK